jgi:hypothetical protein
MQHHLNDFHAVLLDFLKLLPYLLQLPSPFGFTFLQPRAVEFHHVLFGVVVYEPTDRPTSLRELVGLAFEQSLEVVTEL